MRINTCIYRNKYVFLRFNKHNKRIMYTEIAKIIEGGLQKDVSKVASYANLLAQKCESAGDSSLAMKIRKILAGDMNQRNLVKEDFYNIPVDSESRLSIADIYPPQKQNDLILSASISHAVQDFVDMVNHFPKLLDAGLDIHLSLLLYGPPGCGKTTIAKSIANQLGLPLLVARLDSMISSLLGSTSKNLRKLFEYAGSKPCILFLDEFDAIAKNRNDQNEQGELKRVINSLLQDIDDYLVDGNILIAATNRDELLDAAIWRRFATVVAVDKPGTPETLRLIDSLLSGIGNSISSEDRASLAPKFESLSYSEIKKITMGAITKSIIKGNGAISYLDMLYSLFQYTHFNDFSEESVVKYFADNNITQREIAAYFGISTRQVRNRLNIG